MVGKGNDIHDRGNVPADESCRFCRIIRGEEQARIVFADAYCVAFLDRRPLFPGHTLLVPRDHHCTLSELPPGLVPRLFGAARLLARAVEEAMSAEGSFVALNNRVSQSVPHLHVHIVPRRRGDGLKGFFWPRQAYPDDATAERVRKTLSETVEKLATASDATPIDKPLSSPGNFKKG